jgi:hypothetical protein
MWELIYDYAFRTPVWTSTDNKYYPGGSSTAPTVVASKLITPIALLSDGDAHQCGITKLKAEAIQYLSNAASDKASSLGGLVGGSFGGLHFGLGVLGKISVGDNQTLQALVKASLGEAAERATEEASYRVLYWIPYNNETLLADLVQQYLDNKSKTK